MSDYECRAISKKSEWEAFLAQRPEANFLQSYNWGQFYLALGEEVDYTGFYRGEELVGVMLTIVERAKRATYLTVPGGPIMDWSDRELRRLWGERLRELGEKYGAVFVRCRPQLPDDEAGRRIFAQEGWVEAPMHLHAQLTLQLDLEKSEAELLGEMRKNTRYEIRKAGKLGLTVTSTADPQAVVAFHQLQLETATRQHFVPFALSYWQRQFEVFARDGEVLLYSAWQGETLLAQAFVIFYGAEAVYHYGASAEAGRKYPGAYLIQWEAIQEAKRRRLKRYNFWGVAPEGEPEHRFASLSTFKRGFGGQEVAYLPARDLVLRPVAYRVNWLVEKGRQKWRKV